MEFMVKEEGLWKIDREKQLAPKIRVGTTVVEVQVDQCTVALDSNAITSGNVAFLVENVGIHPHQMVLSRVPEGLDLMDSNQSEAGPGIEHIAYVNTLAPGEQTNLAFAEPLSPGRYVYHVRWNGETGTPTETTFDLLPRR